MITVTEMTTNELEALKILIDEELKARQPRETFTFDITATERTYGTAVKPYVAHITRVDGNSLVREFKKLDYIYGKREVRLEGTYTAQEGDLLEIQFGGTVKNKKRDFFVVFKGQEVHVGHAQDTETISQVCKYLRGNLKVTEFPRVQKHIEKQHDDFFEEMAEQVDQHHQWIVDDAQTTSITVKGESREVKLVPVGEDKIPSYWDAETYEELTPDN